MIASFFSKSKPINFLSIALIVVFAVVFENFESISYATFGVLALKIFVALFTVFLLDFVVSKNQLSKKNNYAILFFGLTVLIFPQVTKHLNYLIANLFVLFALRRLLSLRSQHSLKKKFFDTAFWITLAYLLLPWASVFYAVIIVALLYYWQSDFKNIAVCIFGILTVVVLTMCFNILKSDAYWPNINFQLSYSFDFSDYNTTSAIIAFTAYFSLCIWSLFFYIKSVLDKNRKERTTHILVIFMSLLAFILAIMIGNKTGNEFLFLLAPFSIIIANYFETIKENWFKELLVALLLVLPVINLIL